MPTQAPIGLNLAAMSDPSLVPDQLSVDQRQAIANLLIQQGVAPMTGTEMAGQVAIRKSPLEGAAKIAALLSGQNMQASANRDQLGLAERQAMALIRNFQGPQGDGQDRASAALASGAQAGSVGPTVANASRMDSAPQSQAGGPLSIPGMTPQQNMLSYMSDPSAHMKALLAAYEQTPEMKAASAAYGYGSPQYLQAMRALAEKNGYIAPIDAKPGTPVLDPRTLQPRFFAPKTADGVGLDFADPLKPTAYALPGYADANAAITAKQKAAESANSIRDVTLSDGSVVPMWAGSAAGGSPTRSGSGQVGSAAPRMSGGNGTGEIGYAPQATPLAAQSPSGSRPPMRIGQPTAERTGAEAGARDVISRNQMVLADANTAPLDIESLHRMIDLSNGANFGPGASQAAKWKAMAAQIPGIGLIANPQSLQDQQTNVTLMKKFMSGMAGRMSGSSGTGTDARLQNAIDSLPNDAAPDAAIRIVAPMLIAQRTARIDEANLRSQLGNDPAAIQAFESRWRNAYSPLAYEATLATRNMTPQQAAAFVQRTYTPSQAAEIAKSRAALRALGVPF